MALVLDEIVFAIPKIQSHSRDIRNLAFLKWGSMESVKI